MSGLESSMGPKFGPLTGKEYFLPFGAHNVTLNLEIFLNFILLFLLVFFESFSFLQITSFQSYGL